MCDSQKRGPSHRLNFAHETALTDAGRTQHTDHNAVPLDCTVQQGLNGGHLPPPTGQIRLRTPHSAMPFPDTQQPVTRNRLVGALDVNQLKLTKVVAPSTSRAVDALSIAPTGGATDSIRCAIPTCSPIVV